MSLLVTSRSLLGFGLAVSCSPAVAPERPQGPTAPQTNLPATVVEVEPPPATMDAGVTVTSPEPLPDDHVRSQADCPDKMVFIPGGRFTYRGVPWDVFNSGMADIITREFDIKPFCIDRQEVESLTFNIALDLIKKPLLSPCSDTGGAMPATCLTQEMAAQYCRTGVPGVVKRLPSAEEWLYAALGTDGRRFPWGDTWFPWGNNRFVNRPNYRNTGKVFCDLRDRHVAERVFDVSECSLTWETMDISPFGVENMGSNVLELTSTTYVRQDDLGRNNRRCPFFGLNHMYQSDEPDPDPPPKKGLAEGQGISCDERDNELLRIDPLVGFRCATSKRQPPQLSDSVAAAATR